MFCYWRKKFFFLFICKFSFYLCGFNLILFNRKYIYLFITLHFHFATFFYFLFNFIVYKWIESGMIYDAFAYNNTYNCAYSAGGRWDKGGAKELWRVCSKWGTLGGWHWRKWEGDAKRNNGDHFGKGIKNNNHNNTWNNTEKQPSPHPGDFFYAFLIGTKE